MKEKVKSVAVDASALAGAALMVYGAWTWHPAAGFFVAGVELLGLAYLGAKR